MPHGSGGPWESPPAAARPLSRNGSREALLEEEGLEVGAPEEDPVSPVFWARARPQAFGEGSARPRCDWVALNGAEWEEPRRSDDEPPLRPKATPTAEQVAGPARRFGPLDFVDSEAFQALCGLVLAANLTVITYECTSEDGEQYRLWDVIAFAFYIFELACRIGRHRCEFCFSEGRWWRLADAYVAMCGVIKYAALPLAMSCGVALGHTVGVVTLALTVLSRLLRLLKLIRLVSMANLAWTETPGFQWTVAAVIATNAVIMGVETDHPSPVWWWVNQAMLAFFLFEVAARMRMEGVLFFFMDPEDQYWNVIDFLIVVFGAIDLWASRLMEWVSGTKHVAGFSKLMMLVRMLRLLRILRLLKLVKAVGPLYSLALGVTQAMQSIFWVLVLTMVTLYAFAILTTRMVGHALIVRDPSDVPPDIRAMFATIWDSMFTLFGIMNNQHFAEIQPLLTLVPATKPVFVLFTICSSWALLSVMTGVVSDHMMSVREMQAQKDEVAQEERRLGLQKSLRGIFAAADKDGSGTLGNDEYMELLRSPFHKERIQELTRMPVQDLAMMFEWLDVDRSGEIDFQELLHGCDWLNEPINGKSVLKIGHAASSHCASIREAVVKLRADTDKLRQRRQAGQAELRGLLREFLDARERLREADARLVDARLDFDAAREELSVAREGIASATAMTFSLSGGDAAPRAADSMGSLVSKPNWAR